MNIVNLGLITAFYDFHLPPGIALGFIPGPKLWYNSRPQLKGLSIANNHPKTSTVYSQIYTKKYYTLNQWLKSTLRWYLESTLAKEPDQ